MSIYKYQKYAWLPMELKLTGYNYETYHTQLSHLKDISSYSDQVRKKDQVTKLEREIQEDSRRFYAGTPEILSLLDEAKWPPEKSDDFLIWNPSILEEKTREMSEYINGHIVTYLFNRLSADLNLFDLCWKDMIINYVRNLSDQPKGLQLPAEFTEPTKIGLPQYEFFRERNKTSDEKAKKEREELISSLNPSTVETFKALIMSDGLDRLEIDYTAFAKYNELVENGASPESIYISQQSNHPFLRYKLTGSGLPLDIEEKINENLVLQLRLKLWWGWLGAPFTCIENMMTDCLPYLVREGYLRHLGGMKYELPEKIRKNEKVHSLITKALKMGSKVGMSAAVTYVGKQMWGLL